MNRTRRGIERINYLILGSTGERVVLDPIEEDINNISELLDSDEMAASADLRVDILVINEDLKDILDENQIDGFTMEDSNNIIQKLESLRNVLRRKIIEFKTLNADEFTLLLEEGCNTSLANVKTYIKEVNEYKTKLNLKDVKVKTEEMNQKERSMLFLIEDTQRCITELEKEFSKKIVDATDQELIEWKSELPRNTKRFDKLAEKYKEILVHPINKAEFLIEVKNIGERYGKLTDSKQLFVSSLTKEALTRELDKSNLFNEKRLNIKIQMFSGYDSAVDIFTFQAEFEKVHLRTTPSRLLPDLLKNNFLSEPALTLVKSLDNIDDIWKRLKGAYGDTRIMLSKKLQQIMKLDSLAGKSKETEKILCGLSKVVNILKDLMLLAEKHNIEDNLFYGDGLEKIYKLLGDSRLTRWLSSICDQELSRKETWIKLIIFLEKEQRLQQQKLLIQGVKSEVKPGEGNNSDKRGQRYKGSYYSPEGTSEAVCFICGAVGGSDNHVTTSGPGGRQIIQYFTCKAFVDMTPAARVATLRDKGFCFQCLLPGAVSSLGKHKEGKCQHDFVCSHQSHHRYPVKKHVLVCEEHKDSDENRQLLEKYKQRCIRSSDLPGFSKDISLSFHVNNCFKVNQKSSSASVSASASDRGIYLLQTISINNKKFTIFYDNGCSDFVVKHSALKMLGSNATQESAQLIRLGGVGNTHTESTYGTYNVNIPMYDGETASLSGTCLQKITSTFPCYPLDGVAGDIQKSYKSAGGDASNLPKLPSSVGGDVHFMIGVKYLRYHPKIIFQLPSGLAIYESVFVSADGGRGVIGGPHQVFTKIHQHHFNTSEETNFLADQYNLFRMGFQVNLDVPLLGFQPAEDENNEFDATIHLSNQQRIFEQIESAGSEITYRCTVCRSCSQCKNHEEIEAVSIREEVEQSIINASVNVDVSNRSTTATLPFISDPASRLAPNKYRAMKVYEQQLRKLSNPVNKKDKDDILQSEAKLQQLGYVDYIKNLPPDVQKYLAEHQTQNFIPWRAVWKGNSVSTPCRIVFDASQATSSGYSLNDILAKGKNNLNRLQEMFIRWTIHRVAVHSDIRKMYNTIKLDEKDWCYQRYIWQPDLDPSAIPEEKVIKTLIYGVRSSGNQAEYGLRKVAMLSKDEYPEANNIIQRDIYVDDCITGEDTKEAALNRADQLEIILNRGGFQLKGVSFSGDDPPDTLSDDGLTIHVGGMVWYPKDDLVSLNVNELNFSKKRRGKKLAEATNVIPTKLTRRHCASKVAEIFDITGKVAALTASMKLDLQELVHRKLDWDDVIPDDLRSIWESNFDMMKEIGNLKFKRAIVPEDAVSLDINTLDFGDASQSLVCVCIYARFLRRNGQYSCQLVLSRTRVVPRGMSQPRAELYAALINAYTGEVVKRSFYNWHQSSIKFTDSQITLHWIHNEEKPLKQWVRNRVIEIRRFSSKQQWNYVQSKEMIADLGTRKGATLEDVSQSSSWINGFGWMQQDSKKFPMMTIEDLKLSKSEVCEIQKEHTIQVHYTMLNDNTLEEVNKRYQYSQYLIDPNLHCFKAVVRVMAYVMKFCRILLNRLQKSKDQFQHSADLTDEEISSAEVYFYKKGTAEVEYFLPLKKYEKFAEKKDQLLIYKGRILPTSSITIVGGFTKSMKDLSSDSFCVPVLERYSPVAYSVALDVHWNDSTVKHSGVETTLRFILKKVFIIEGRSLIKQIKSSCERCRYLAKRTVDLVMGPVPPYSMTIAPAFYFTQMDLSGPYKAYSAHNKRGTVKVWLIVFCCCSTSTVSIKVMDDYSTTAFIQAFTRFACDVGFPKRLLCDEGSQLVKGCQDMRLTFRDIKSKLLKEVRVEFEVCPVQGHNMHGKVERKIKEINLSLEKCVHNERLSLLQWETISAMISNNINNLPLALGNITGDFECMDLITPNRLRLGRNNNRSPAGEMIVTCSPSKILTANVEIYNSWFESWLLVHVPRLMEQQKWFKNDVIKVGDVVLFLKNDSSISSTYTYGMVTDLEFSGDNVARKAKVKYRNSNEEVFRETFRAVRSLVVIQHVDECDIITELGRMAQSVDSYVK